MSYDIGVACRASAGFVTDGAGFTYCLGEDYPTTRGGITFGWSPSGVGGTTRDRDNTVYVEIAGTNRTNTASGALLLDLPASGAATIHIALGDVSSNFLTIPTKAVLKDGSTTIATLQNNTEATGLLMDATGALISAANWVANEVGIAYTFAGTQLSVNFDGTYPISAGNTICYVRVVQAGATFNPGWATGATKVIGGAF